jgi:hypothetical protein
VLAGSGIRPEAYGPHWPRLPSPASPAPTGLACPHRPRLPPWRGGGFGTGVESKRERMKKLNCLSIQEKENTKLIYREKTILGIGLRLWQSALGFPSLSFIYKSIVFLLFGSTDNSSSSLLLHHLLVSTESSNVIGCVHYFSGLLFIYGNNMCPFRF